MIERSRAREQTKHETREALVAAALAEFGRHGLDAPSLDAICARAGFTRGAFYVHFRNRDELVVAAMERVLGAFLDAIIGTGDEPQDLETTLTRFAGALFAMADPRFAQPRAEAIGAVPLHRLLEACHRSAVVRERFVGLVRDAIERLEKAAASGKGGGRVRADVDSGSLATMLAALALGVFAAREVGLPMDLDLLRATVARLLAPR
ncbi:HTH-type transcriptional regulator MtrR [Burkholderiales bacterium]|jgi:AcrR family transcriptional regulator|nr:HTH-type transcriptional regulator MtrR [Burkholderiales bacterium]